MASVLDAHMNGRQFIVGEKMTIADCITAYVLDWGNENGLIDACPNLRAYFKRMYARPEAPPRIAAELSKLQSAA